MSADLKVIDVTPHSMRNPLAERGGVIITSIPEAMEIVSVLGSCNLLPDDIKSKGDVFMVIMAGAELGLGPMAAIRSLHIIKGKVSMSAELILARLLAQGVKAEWLESSSTAARLQLTRPGSAPYEETFTVEDATRAQLLPGKPFCNWQKYTKAMLRARCVSAAARAYAPDLMAGGCIYVPEELEEIEVEQVRPLSAVQQDVRADDPEVFDAAVELHDAERAAAEDWFKGQKAVLDNMGAVGRALKKAKPESDEDRDTHMGEVDALYQELTKWIDQRAADYRALNTKAGIPLAKKAFTQLRHASEACGIGLVELRQKIAEAAKAIDADVGDESE